MAAVAARFFVLTATRFFVLTGASASRPPCPGSSQRCWGLASVALCCTSAQRCTVELQWICITAAARLMLAGGTTTIDKSLLVPFVALQAPSATAITFLAKDYHGPWNFREDHARSVWTGFLDRHAWWVWARLLTHIASFLYITTGDWRRATSTAVLVGIAMVPSQVMNLRESQGRAILSSAIAVYLAFQHFTGAGSLRKAFAGVAATFTTLCIVCMTTISLMLVF